MAFSIQVEESFDDISVEAIPGHQLVHSDIRGILSGSFIGAIQLLSPIAGSVMRGLWYPRRSNDGGVITGLGPQGEPDTKAEYWRCCGQAEHTAAESFGREAPTLAAVMRNWGIGAISRP